MQRDQRDPRVMAEALEQRAQDHVREEQERRAAAAQANRERMPEATSIIDEVRNSPLGEGLKVAYAEENGHVVRANIKGEDGGDVPRRRVNGKWIYG